MKEETRVVAIGIGVAFALAAVLIGSLCSFTNVCIVGGNEDWARDDARQLVGKVWEITSVGYNNPHPNCWRRVFELKDEAGNKKRLVVTTEHKFASTYNSLTRRRKVIFSFHAESLDIDMAYHRRLTANYLIPSPL